MLIDWIHWLSSLHPDQLLSLLIGLLLIDAPRYALSKILLCLWDSGSWLMDWLKGTTRVSAYSYCPSVCVILAGHNEAETIESTLASVWGSYPKLEIIVVDDGSTDGMAEAARQFARRHAGVLVLSRPQRGGKSSAMNFALPFSRADIVVVVDADSDLGPNAIWEIVQPMGDPEVGAVAGTILGRNSFANLVTWLQAYEYLSTIFIGRMLAARLDLLGIVSGAFGAFRKSVLEQVKGWDVGPPEDLDLTLTIRKAGYRIAFAPYAECFTDLPNTWLGLFRQRLRWDRSGVVRNHCRKHLDMAHFWSAHFRFGNLLVLVDNWVFNLFGTFAICGWMVWVFVKMAGETWQLLITIYALYLIFELIQILVLAFYSVHLRRDMFTCLVFFLIPFYQTFLLAVRLLGHIQEIFFRMSFEDNYVPEHVRQATWRW